jgi:hypothetical protein
MDKKKANHKASPETSRLHNNSLSAQLTRLLARLRIGQTDTFSIMRELNICRPGARICDLRTAGYSIHTRLISVEDEWGRKHPKVALYTLLAEPSSAS